ncbi:MAG: MFS transporter [Sphingopyxis sp.]|nr:MFS transporter [Sphingopyxis sp.]
MWDALFDPVMGYIANRTRTRWGRYRPYLLFGGLPLAASWTLIFLPVELEGSALILFAVSAHMIFRTLYAIVSMPYLALSATMTGDSHERGILASIRMIAATTCGLFAAFSTLKLVEAFGGGSTGFFWTAMVYGCIAAIFFVIVFASTKEIAPAPDEKAPSPGDMIAMLRHNSAFWIVCAAMLAGAFGGTLFSKTLPYYFKYALERPDLIGLALTALTGAIAISMPIWTSVMKRSSKRTMWLCGAGVSLCGYALLWFSPLDATNMLLPIAIIGFGAGATYLGFWSMMPDTVEFGEWKSGIRSEGAVFGFVSLIQKGALGLAAAMLGELLSAIGYRANAAQSAETLAMMRMIMIGGAGGLALFAAFAISFYPIDRRMHTRLQAAIRHRRQRAALRSLPADRQGR